MQTAQKMTGYQRTQFMIIVQILVDIAEKIEYKLDDSFNFYEIFENYAKEIEKIPEGTSDYMISMGYVCPVAPVKNENFILGPEARDSLEEYLWGCEAFVKDVERIADNNI